MYSTNAVAQKSIVQIWDQVKNWSREDRGSLAKLIEKSLDDECSSDGSTLSFIKKLDDKAMCAAADLAYRESRDGRSIPHSQVLDAVKAELRWK